MADNKVTLFDLPSQGTPHCWSLNPWKARLCLNYKGIPYETRWIEYPDIAELFKSFGLQPNDAPGATAYTIPAVQMADGRYIMESFKIAEALEATYPTPSLHLDSPRVQQAQDAVTQTFRALARVAMVRVPDKAPLNPRSAEYFRRTRAARFEMPWEELELKDPAAIDAAWEKAAEGIKQLQSLVAEDPAGPYVMGKEPGYADFVLAGLWRMMQIIDKEGDLYGRLMKYDQNFEKHHAACEHLLKRDD